MNFKLIIDISYYFIYIGEIASAIISINSFLCKYILPTYSEIEWFDKIIKTMHKLALNPSFVNREVRRDI
jgi:hypothetical protein